MNRGDGAQDLLQVLAQSEALEELDLNGCWKIPESAWQQLPDNCWPKLRRQLSSRGVPEEQRLGQGAAAEGLVSLRVVRVGVRCVGTTLGGPTSDAGDADAGDAADAGDLTA